VLEGFDLAPLDAGSAENYHLLIEAMRVAFRDRVAFVDDPAFIPVPFRGLISKAYAETRRATIERDRAQEASGPGDPWPFDESSHDVLPQGPTVAWGPSGGDTTHFTVTDRDGMTISMTQSLIDAFGSGVVVPGTGMLLNSAMHNYNPIPGQVGSIAPWKRASHYGTPTIVLRKDGSPAVAIGGAGGTMVPTGIVQILVNVLDRGWSIQDAVSAPRVHCEGWDSLVDGRIDPAVVADLQGMGHRLVVRRPGYAQPAFSRINGIALGGSGGATSGTDPFGDAGAAAPAA
jgi:gamma-glutamyltranspeptidase/glutathione hydrolase